MPPLFDIPYMTQLAIGPAWATLPDPQRQLVIQAFDRYVTAVYAERFDKYAGERLEVIGEEPTSYGTVVKTQIVKADGEPVTLNYLMVNGAGADHKSAMCTSAAPSANSPRGRLIFRRRCAPKVFPVSSPSSATRLSLWRQHSPGALPTAEMTAANHAERCTGPVR
ncbi:MAG: ABC transporter substrate-binding protein [Acidobacteria bacterium]|nr:ABC transporter substrate-binding protein [Acidobacteriota bacterium]